MAAPEEPAAAQGGEVDYIRASGECVCAACGKDYFHHPPDTSVLGYDGRPFLRIVCGGQRVKL